MSRRAAEAGGEADAQHRLEPALDPLVERAEDAVELVLVDGGVGDLAHEEDGVLLADGERRAVQPGVQPQQVLVEGARVLLRRRHDVGLVVQGALAQVEPDREDVLGLTPHPHEPPSLARGAVALDGLHDRVLRPLALEPTLDAGRELVELLRGRRTLDHGRTLPARPPGGASRVGLSRRRSPACGPPGRRRCAAAWPRSSTTCSRGPGGPRRTTGPPPAAGWRGSGGRGRRRPGGRAARRGSRCARARPACAGRRPPPPRRGCRRRPPRARPARTTRSGSAPARPPPPGSSWRAGGAAGGRRTGPARPRRAPPPASRPARAPAPRRRRSARRRPPARRWGRRARPGPARPRPGP